jgi:hypothetical protein
LDDIFDVIERLIERLFVARVQIDVDDLSTPPAPIMTARKNNNP